MRTNPAAVVAVLALVVLLVVAPVAALQSDSPTAADETETAPGERLSGVVAVGEAEVEGDVAEREFGQRVAAADGNASKAAVVGQQVDGVDERLTALEREKERLQRARENGSISEGRYRAEMAELAARTATAHRLANHSAAVAADLPEQALAAQGVDREAIRTLRQRADELSGPEVAAIARSVAGRDVGRSVGGPPEGIPADNRSGGPGTPGGGPPDGGDERPGDGGDVAAGDAPDGSDTPARAAD